ncbi:MAG: CCA tRNA nucleotidyltransferase, partial [Eubacterium sp.]
MTVSEKSKKLISIIENSGYEAYEVGGCVRDRLMNREFDDIDITTSATPDEIEKILKKSNIKYIETGLKHGTVTALLNDSSFEITTYRTDGGYADSRHPDSVSFVTDIKEDLSRRDFTINAMAYNEAVGLVDLYGGRDDINNKIIRTVGDADKRFNEDALRIMRALRFASVLGFAIEESTEKAAFKNKELLKNISYERLFAELSKLLMGDYVFD